MESNQDANVVCFKLTNFLKLNTYWRAILIWRWIHDEGKSIKSIQAINSLGEEVVSEVAQKVKEATRYHPIGQLDKSAFIKTVNQGIHDISAALGIFKIFVSVMQRKYMSTFFMWANFHWIYRQAQIFPRTSSGRRWLPRFCHFSTNYVEHARLSIWISNKK